MKRETRHWGTRELGWIDENRSPLRVSIATELPETRIFIDKLYRNFTASGRRLHTDQLIQNRGDSPWLPVTGDEDP